MWSVNVWDAFGMESERCEMKSTRELNMGGQFMMLH